MATTSISGTHNPPITLTLQSRILDEERKIYVQLPEGHDKSNADFPVLIVLDGEWIFEVARANTRFYSEHHAMDTAIPKMIVVGIENHDRDKDYVPTPDPDDPPTFPTAGEANNFLRFLKEELFPLIEKDYKAAPSRAVVGWSYGGLLAMYSALEMPELFNAYLCIGPAIWWEDDLVVKMYEQAKFEKTKRMVITLGSGEEGSWVHTSTTKLLEQLKQNPIEGLEISY